MSNTLSRSLQPRHITMISIGGIIGAGLFVGSSASIAAAGPAVVVSYLIAGLLVLLVMRMVGELAVSLPGVRSFTDFARAGLGHAAGFVSGWLYWYFWIVTVAIEAIAGANILHAWIALPAWVLGLALMATMTAVNLMSTRSYGEVEFWFSSTKVAAIVVFIALAATFACGLPSHPPTFGNLTAHGGFMPHGMLSVLAGTVTVYFSLTGAEVTTIAAAESTQPERAIAKMTTSIMIRIMTFYIGSILLIVCVVPWTLIRVGESPFTLALATMGFGWASKGMGALILVAVLSCLNSAFFVCSRVLFVLAEHGDAPKSLVRLNARRVPSRSVWLSCFAGVLGIAAATAFPQTLFAFLVNASGALVIFIYIMIALAQIRIRRQRERAGAPEPRLTMWLFPWLSYLAVAGMIAVLVAMTFTPAFAADLQFSLLALLVASTAYFLSRSGARSAQGHHWSEN